MSHAPISQSPDSLERSLKNEDKLINVETGAVGAASGIAVGALAGAIAGPPGAIAGAVIGAVVGALTGNAINGQRTEERIEEKERSREDVAIDQGFMPHDPTVLPHMRVDAMGLPVTEPQPDSRMPTSVLPLVGPGERIA